MRPEDFQSYLNDRYAEMLKFYDHGAIWNKRYYYCCAIYVLAVSAAIGPIVFLFKAHGDTIAAFLSASVTVLAAVSGLFRFHENWLSYRATWDAMKRELYWHNAAVGAYAGAEDPNGLFVEHVEALVAREGADWLRLHRDNAKQDASGSAHGA